MGRDLQSLKQTTDMKTSNGLARKIATAAAKTVDRSVQSEAIVPKAQDTYPPSLKRFMGKPFGEDGVKITHNVDWNDSKVVTRARGDMGTLTLTTKVIDHIHSNPTDNVSITMSSQQVILTLGELKTIIADLEKLLPIVDGEKETNLAA